MKKSDLEDGMIVELRKGTRFMYINDYLYNEMHEYNISHYNDDLLHYQNIKILDIVKVYRVDVANIKNIFKLIKLGDILTDKYLKLIWERKEIDWSEVPFGADVRVWDEEDDIRLGGKFLGYNKEGIHKYHVFVDITKSKMWENCELIESQKEEREFTIEEIQRHYRHHCEKVGCDKCNCNSDDESCWTIFIAQNYNITRK